MIRIGTSGRNGGNDWQRIIDPRVSDKYCRQFYLEGMPTDIEVYEQRFDAKRDIIREDRVIVRLGILSMEYDGSKIDSKHINKEPCRSIYTCEKFGKLTFLYKGHVADVVLNGKKVGLFNTRGVNCNIRWYKKRCKRKQVKPIQRLKGHMFEFDERYISSELIAFVVRMVYGSEIEWAS